MTQGSFPKTVRPKRICRNIPTRTNGKFFAPNAASAGRQMPLQEEPRRQRNCKKERSGIFLREDRSERTKPYSTRRHVLRTETYGKANTEGDSIRCMGFTVSRTGKTMIRMCVYRKETRERKIPHFRELQPNRKRKRNFRSKARSSAKQDERKTG